MPYAANVLEVMVASPGDVQDERDVVQRVLLHWNSLHIPDRRMVFHPILWEIHAAPDLAGRAQGVINDRLLFRCDLLVAVFWTRLGSPTGIHESGTVEEIKMHLAEGKPAMVYFSRRPVVPGSYETDQYNKVLEFKEWCCSQGIVKDFNNVIDFEREFRDHLELILRDNPYLAKVAADSQASVSNETTVAKPERHPLTPEALDMLLKASESSRGHILRLPMLAGTMFQAGDVEIEHDGSQRAVARLEGALVELEDCGFIRDKGYKREVFSVTDAGYRGAEELLRKQGG